MKSIYLKLSGPDMKGESMDKEHDQWIELSSLRHQMHQPTSPSNSTAGGHTVGRTEHGDFSVEERQNVLGLMRGHQARQCRVGSRREGRRG